MKNTALIIGLILLFSCSNSKKKEIIPTFQENQLSFLHLKYGCDIENDWIRNPKNIWMLHETFKKIGYKNLISKEDWTNDWIWSCDIWKSPKNLTDSLELTFENFEESPKYYREFWQRRKKEGNEKVVYQVVKEIQQIILENVAIEVNQKLVNDTLEQLLYFEFPYRELSTEEANNQLEYLINIGLHQSAYNLVSDEVMGYDNVIWKRNKTAIIEDLINSETHQMPWLQDDTK